MSEPVAWWNGSFVPLSRVHLALNDAGFVFGATATDFCRTFRHRLFRLEAHLERFRQSCRLIRVPQPRTDAELAATAGELVRRNSPLLDPAQDLALVLFATPGEIGYYLGRPGGPGDAAPTLCLYTFPLRLERFARPFREGVHLVTPESRYALPAGVAAQAKQRSRLHWWLAEREVQERDPGAHALLLDAHGGLTETAAANVLLVRQGKVLTPFRAQVLGGISLLVVEELCRELGIPFREQELTLNDCFEAEEAMLSSTPYCLVPVRQINGLAIPCPGPVFGRLLQAWSEKVGMDIAAQILAASSHQPGAPATGPGNR
jgi:branched-subunit amino acid aminotransferase/4-amino-4-deoxychorismate lyase